MYRFNNDYSQGAHPKVIEALTKTNTDAYAGYGLDAWCEKAEKQIKARLKSTKCAVHFLVGGTQTNFVGIDALIRPYESVICADTGHIHVHECGAVESRGHKIEALPHTDGKISADQVRQIAENYANSPTPEHVTVPGVVYISFPTEYGTIYSKKELSDMYKVCKKYGMRLFIDGARLAYGLGASDCDVKFEDLPKLCDAFYIGGTKCGALMGEALVLCDGKQYPFFRNYMKQSGAMLAKGWLLGLQYSVLFEDDLYFELGKKADAQAQRLKAAFKAKGFEPFIDNNTNQLFVTLDKKTQDRLAKDFVFEPEDGCVRFCTAWYTEDKAIDALIKALNG